MITIMPFSSSPAKNLPPQYWEELTKLFNNKKIEHVYIVGPNQEIPWHDKIIKAPNYDALLEIYQKTTTFICVDTALQHIFHLFNKKYNKNTRGIVFWVQSDPLIFGYEENINANNRTTTRLPQYAVWADTPVNADAIPPFGAFLKIIEENIK